MVDWRDPAAILKQAQYLLKLAHVLDGVYIWEFFSNCGYDWRVVREQRWKWTLLLYLGCRLFTLAGVVTNLTGLNIMTPINCQAWVVLTYAFTYAASSMALALYGLRTVAVWKEANLVSVFVAAISTANIVLWIYSITQARATWNTSLSSCAVTQTERGLPSTSCMLATNFLILVVIVMGILRPRPKLSVLYSLLCREGALWLLFAVIIQILPLMFIALNLSDIMNLIFQPPALICYSIGATRTYRALSQNRINHQVGRWDASAGEVTSGLRFRRSTNPAASIPSGGVPMAPVRRGRDGRERYVERFEAQEIKLDEEVDVDVDVKASSYDLP